MQKIISIIKRLRYPISFFVIVLLVIFIWFHKGILLAGGEEGMQFYNPIRSLGLFSSLWYEIGSGYPIPVLLPRAPLFFLLSFPFRLGIPAWFLQAATYFALLLSGLCFFFLFAKQIFYGKKLPSFIAACFYLFNLYSLSQIWGRFLLTNIFAWSFLPLFLLLWYKIVTEKTWIYILLLLLSSLAFSFAYGMPAMLLVLWVPVMAMGVVLLVRGKGLEEKAKIAVIALVSTLTWILSNIWWLYPYLTLTNVSFSKVALFKDSFDSLASVSQYFPTNDIILLRQSFLFGKDSPWGVFYNHPLIIALSLAVFCIVGIGITVSRKEKNWITLLLILVIGWFVSKGTNPPFGFGFFYFLFSHFPFSQVLRNSYEKFGIVFMLPYAMFFGYGMYWIIKQLERKIAFVFSLITLVLVCGLLVFPFWTGAIFKTESVIVPPYYKQINLFLQQDKLDGRILSLPFLQGDSVHYIFPQSSYQGIEASESLLDRQTVSKILRADYYDDFYTKAYNAFTTGQEYNSYLDTLNIRYIILHDDLDNKASGTSRSAQVISQLQDNPSIHFVKTFGKLSLYTYDSLQKGVIRIEGQIQPIRYQKINQTHFRVLIHQTEQPFSLIFLNTYSPIWIAKIGRETVNTHSLYNGVANQWKISRIGTYTIDIVFAVWPWEK